MKESSLACYQLEGFATRKKTNPAKEPGELRIASKYQRRSMTGEEVRSRTWGGRRGIAKPRCNQEVGTTVGCYRGAQRWLETTGLFDGGCWRRRSLVADHRLHHEAVGHVVDGVAAVRLTLVDAWEGRPPRTHHVKRTERIAANNPTSTTIQMAQTQ